jgi:phosphopantothenoylcysteine decarboxylase/phosphopantothenate--cysteine ligase
MGYALAEVAKKAGAVVTLISGPVDLSPPSVDTFIAVTSADDMYKAVMTIVGENHIFISAAAVGDYRAAQKAPQKIKRTEASWVLDLLPNLDITKSAREQNPDLFIVGFAAETDNIEKHAAKKLRDKKLNIIVANDVSNSEIGFGSDDNAVTLLTGNGEIEKISQQSKAAIAEVILRKIQQ